MALSRGQFLERGLIKKCQQLTFLAAGEMSLLVQKEGVVDLGTTKLKERNQTYDFLFRHSNARHSDSVFILPVSHKHCHLVLPSSCHQAPRLSSFLHLSTELFLFLQSLFLLSGTSTHHHLRCILLYYYPPISFRIIPP